MHVVVIGAGIIGVTTAYYLRQAGADVTVVERNSGVAQEASFANAGVIAPAYVAPWAQPGMPGKVLAHLFRAEGPLVFRPRMDAAQWRWLARWLFECRAKRFQRNKDRMQRLARYSRSLLHELRAHHGLDYEQTQGYLQLFRRAADLDRSAAARESLIQAGVAHRLLTAEECRRLEPAIDSEVPLAGGLFLPEDETGNCAYFARKLKDVCMEDGVRFHFGTSVRSLVAAGDRVESLRLAGGNDAGISADAFVLAAGVDSAAILKTARLPLPIFPVKGYSATAVITHGELAPRIAVMDESHKVAITRMGNRLRIAGTAEIGARRMSLRDAALRTLMKVASDWFPHAANYTQAQYWVGARPMLPDGPPVLGPTRYANLFLNVGHGSSGWAMACGSGRIVADAILQRPSEIDLDGLTINRYRRYR